MKRNFIILQQIMNHIANFESNAELIDKFGIGNAHIIWTLSLYLDFSDRIQLGSESLTDGSDDKKIDFIRYDKDTSKIIFAQGYYSSRKNDSAPANKASDLNTAAAWLFSGDLKNIPSPLREIVNDCRDAIKQDEVEEIDLLYVHNLPESVAVNKELATVARHLEAYLPDDSNIKVNYKELGIQQIETLFSEIESSIVLKDKIECPAKFEFEEVGPKWKAYILTVSGEWLRDLFLKHDNKLFSANYRGFLGANKRKKINSGIRSTAEKIPENFWVYNNGITILTNKVETVSGKDYLLGISIINGAQTTGSIGGIEKRISLANVRVLARVIECSDNATISEIVKFNNTQNKITTWDKFSNSAEQKRIESEFRDLGHEYSLKRGFSASSRLGIENVIQPLIAFEGYYSEANGGKNGVFESEKMYKIAFDEKKARHILFTFALSRAIDERRNELKSKKANSSIIDIEEKQLVILRNLRFKYFLMSVLGKCLQVIIEKQIDVSQIGFTPEYANASRKTINELVAEVSPVVSLILTYTANSIKEDFSSVIREVDILNNISTEVSSILYGTLSLSKIPAIEKFKSIVC